MIGLIIIESGIEIIDRIDGIIVYNGNGMANTKCSVCMICGIETKYNGGFLVMVYNFTYNLYYIQLIWKWIEVNL